MVKASSSWIFGAVAVAVLISGREPLLNRIGNAIVHEDAMAVADTVVASITNARVTALEAGLLFASMPQAQVLISTWGPEPSAEMLRQLGIPYADDAELSRTILMRSGVPSRQLVLLGPVDGTESEIRAVASFLRKHPTRRLLFITSRSHTARTRWLLDRFLDMGVEVAVRSSRFDVFVADQWWLRRYDSREVMSEYLRWFNSAFVRRTWS